MAEKINATHEHIIPEKAELDFDRGQPPEARGEIGDDISHDAAIARRAN